MKTIKSAHAAFVEIAQSAICTRVIELIGIRAFARNISAIIALVNIRAIGAFLGALVLAGCQVSVQDGVPPQAPFKLTAPEQNCIATSLTVLENYFKGYASQQEVDGAFDCASGALNLFTQYARGSQAESYSDNELRAFMERYFLGDIRVNDVLLLEIMRMKQAVLGGDVRRITRSEIARAHVLIRTLKSEAKRLLPYIQVLTMKFEKDRALADPEFVQNALIQFNLSMENIGFLLSGSSKSYDLKNIETLMREIQSIYAERSDWSGPQFVIDHLPMIMALKEFVLRPNGDTIAPGELSGFVVNGTRMYALYLRIYYLISGRAALSGPGLDQLTLAIYDFFSLLEGAVEAKATKKIEYLQIDRLIDEIYRYELVNWPIRATTLKSLVRIALERVFADPSRRAYGDRPSRVTGLDQGVLVAFKDGLLGWIGMQGLWRDLTTKAAAQVPQLVNTDGSIKPIPMKTIREIWPTLSTPHKRPFEEIAQLFLRSLPLSYSDQDAIVFQSDVSKIVLSQDGFNSLNWKTALARIIAMGFSADPEANRFKGVSRAEFKVFFDVARELAIDFKFVDPADNQIWNSSFTELNLFALSADADEWLSFSEGMDFISYAFSAATMVVKTKDDLKVNCPHLAPDVFGEPTFSAQCFRRQMAKNFPLFYADLPRWARLATNLQSRGTYSDLQWLLESAGRTNGFSSAPIASSDLTRMSMVLHYVEGLFTRFDDNRSGSITLAEARDVYPLFREILKKASGMDDDEKVFAVFTYILQFGRPPETLTEKLYFQFVWKDQPERWTFKADRMQMLNIIASLKAAVS